MSYPKIADYVEKQIKGLWGTDFDDNGIPVIKTNNLTYEGIIDYSDICKRNIDPKQAQNNYLQKGDLLIEKSGGTKTHSVGYVSYFDEENDKYLCNNFILALRPKHKEINSKYLFYQIQFKYESNQFSDCFNKTTGIQNLKVSDYLNKEIKVPDIKKQNDIVLQLDKSRDVITKNKALLEKYDILIKSRFIEMFGDPVTNPMGWEVKKLGDYIQNANNGMARRGNDKDGAIVLRLVELQRGLIDYSESNRILLKENEKKRYELVENDILFARVNGNPDNVGRCAFFKNIGEPVYHNDHIIRVHFDEKNLNEYYLNVILNSKYGMSEFKKYIKTSAGQYTIAQDGIASAEIPVPSLELQQQFAAFVQQIDKSKFVVQKSLEKAETLYKSLMQEYFG